MAKKNKKGQEAKNPLSKINLSLDEGAKHSIISVFSALLGIFLALSFFELGGIAGERAYVFLTKLFGAGFLLLPISLFLVSVSFWRSERPYIVMSNAVGGTLFFISGLGIVELATPPAGGLVGRGVEMGLVKIFGPYAGGIFLVGFLLIGITIIFNTRLSSTLGRLLFWKKENTMKEFSAASPLPESAREEDSYEIEIEEDENGRAEEISHEKSATDDLGEFGGSRAHKKVGYSLYSKEFVPPPLSLLEDDRGKPAPGDTRANANIIKRTLQNFGIDVELSDVSIGPSITRYAFKPAEGVRLSKIVALPNDPAPALAAHPLRIEAPIPGKSLVGIEIPNTKKSVLGIASLIDDTFFKESRDALLVTLGRGITGNPVFANLAKAPHILVAGATGSGKSVTIHSVITSLLYRNPPANMRFVMIDPKRVELTLYNGIPHLLGPVITNPKKAILALKNMIKEMERRYNILETEGTRDILTYHRTVLEPVLAKAREKKDGSPLPEPMPYIVIIVDELADIMATYPKELEAAIIRLAQMSRAVGIHLILSTQRPSVNVITGLIKANVPSRVALQVSSQVDSRTIIDMAGAEKLLGAGDMLYLSGEMSKPLRLQSPFVSENEVKRIVKYLKEQYADEIFEDMNLGAENGSGTTLGLNLEEAEEEPEDDLYEDARDLVTSTGKASATYLQRKLGIGYPRAARIIDILESKGVVGPVNGSNRNQREVYESTVAPVGENDNENL